MSAKTQGGKPGYKDLKYNTWGIYQDSTLYLNLTKLNKGYGYVEVLEFGRYSMYQIISEQELTKLEELIMILFYPKQYRWVKEYWEREEKIFVYDLKTGLTKSIGIPNMYIFLNPNKLLYENYRKESDKDKCSLEVKRKYLNEINAFLPLF